MEKPVLAFHKASIKPLEAIEKVSYEGQLPDKKMYRSGYENFFERIPIFTEDEHIGLRVTLATRVMSELGFKLVFENWYEGFLEPGVFKRTILAISEPEFNEEKQRFVSGPQLMVGHLGKGVETPIHGHAEGFLCEYLLTGKIKITHYEIVDEENGKVKEVYDETIFSSGTYSKAYTKKSNSDILKTRIHKIEALEDSVVLLYFPEFSSDGRHGTYSLTSDEK